MAEISDIFRKAAHNLGTSVLTPEYEIVLGLVDAPNLTADQVLERSSLSRAGFFNTIERLKQWGIIMCSSGLHDRRRRIYRLAGDLRQLILSRFKKYRNDYTAHVNGTGSRDFVSRGITEAREKGLDFFTCEFKILLYLYLQPDMPNNALRDLINASVTKFHYSLKILLERELIRAERSAGDQRLKQYNISSGAHLVLYQLHRDLFQRLDECEPLIHRPHSSPAAHLLVRHHHTPAHGHLRNAV